jgi:hypothetical protein
MGGHTLAADGRISGMGDKLSAGHQDAQRSQSPSWWKHLYKILNESFKASFETDWEKSTGLPWKDWGKL